MEGVVAEEGGKKMPLGDRTGPRGFGPRTGRGLGYCPGSDSPGFTKGPGMERGLGRGFGRGGGRGFGYYPSLYPGEDPYYRPPVYPEQSPEPGVEISHLERVADSLEKELKAVRKRLKELVKKEKNE